MKCFTESERIRANGNFIIFIKDVAVEYVHCNENYLLPKPRPEMDSQRNRIYEDRRSPINAPFCSAGINNAIIILPVPRTLCKCKSIQRAWNRTQSIKIIVVFLYLTELYYIYHFMFWCVLQNWKNEKKKFWIMCMHFF